MLLKVRSEVPTRDYLVIICRRLFPLAVSEGEGSQARRDDALICLWSLQLKGRHARSRMIT